EAAVRASLLRQLPDHGQGPNRRLRRNGRADGRAREDLSHGVNAMDAASFADTFLDWSPQPMLLGLAFGLVHAFDADHVAAISGLAVSDRSTSPTSYAFRWALGHAAALGVIAAFVLGLGVVGLMAVSGYAEAIVAATLVAV